MGPSPLAIYIHWPYCLSKCPYCDFNSHVASTTDHAAFRSAYKNELRHYAALLPNKRITSIFFGGGTPSLMQPETVAELIAETGRLWTHDTDIEITLEANPTSVERDKFRAFQAAGVNRLSLGVQSLRNADLKFLGRAHDADAARGAIELARQTFPRFSFDLIYARKEQTRVSWREELTEALTLAGSHLSLYQLTIEPSTQFYTLAQRGEVLTAPEDDAVGMFEDTQDIMSAAGMPGYEISNHARPGEESRHNLTYWRYDSYLGIGPGAHGRYRFGDDRMMTDNHRAPDVWLRQVAEKSHGVKSEDKLDQETAQREALMMGLRLREGISLDRWHDAFKVPLVKKTDDATAGYLRTQKVERLEDEGFLIRLNGSLRATPSGLQRLNAVLRFLVN